jgi:hypothetical protein
MGSTPRREAVTKPPRPDFHTARIHGAGSLVIGLLTLMSPFVTAQIFEYSPLWIFIVGVILGIASFWLAALTVRAPGGSPGRGMAAGGIILAILGIAFSLFVWAVGSMVLNDAPL